MSNSYDKTKQEADSVDEKIKTLIREKKSFIVEAAAGSGKTYSLNSIVGWLEREKPLDLRLPGKKIACITFTNVAVDVMRSRLLPESNVEPCTIHSFCWNLIKPFQNYMISHIKDVISRKKYDYSSLRVNEIVYDDGVRHFDKETGILYLYHDDVIQYFSKLLETKKFRRIMTSLYPIILIDEYQDSNSTIMNKMIKCFFENESKPSPVFGLFGDSWQCIYSGLNAVGEIKDARFEIIHKRTNFRSESNIVKMLNRIRPNGNQLCAKEDDDSKGNVFYINCSGAQYARYDEGAQKGDLTSEALNEVLETLANKIEIITAKKPKVLMITHKVISKKLGFQKLIDNLGADVFRDYKDPFFEYCRSTIEPLYKALSNNNIPRLADVLGAGRVMIRTKRDKNNWKSILNSLESLRKGTLADVLNYCLNDETGLIPKSDEVESILGEYKINNNFDYSGNRSVKDVLSIQYEEFLSAFEYVDSETIFSTEHSSKGEEFENVVFVINKGWNLYQYHKYVPFNQDRDDAAYIRNRNLFYVCASRAIKNMYFLLTYDGGEEFDKYLRYLSDGNCYELNDYLEDNN